jgi:hypothetical protein
MSAGPSEVPQLALPSPPVVPQPDCPATSTLIPPSGFSLDGLLLSNMDAILTSMVWVSLA